MSTATCPMCAATVSVNRDGSLRRHGPADAHCQGIRQWHIGLPGTKPYTTPNDRLHYHQKARRMAAMKSDARWAIRAAHLPHLDAAQVDLTWRLPDARTRDVDSLQLALKAFLDALVAEGVLTDDGWRYVADVGMHIERPLPKMPAAMWATVTERKPQ